MNNIPGYDNPDTLHVCIEQSPHILDAEWRVIEERVIKELGVSLARLLRQSVSPYVCGPIQSRNSIGYGGSRNREYWIPVWTTNRVDVVIPYFSNFWINRRLSFWERVRFVITGNLPLE